LRIQCKWEHNKDHKHSKYKCQKVEGFYRTVCNLKFLMGGNLEVLSPFVFTGGDLHCDVQT
jgi:hypothetical protein